MFLVNSCLGLFTAASFEAPLIPKLRGQFAEFLNNPSPVGLRILSSSTCVGLRYGHLSILHSFSRHRASTTSLLVFGPFRPGQPTPGFGSTSCNFVALFRLALASAPNLKFLTSQHNVTRRSVLQKVRCRTSIVLHLLVNTGFQVLFHSPPGVLFTFPSRYYALSVTDRL